jgi:hypothetical protein
VSPDHERTAGALEVGLCKRERLTDPQAGTPKHDDKCTQPNAMRALADLTHHLNDLLDPRRISWVSVTAITRWPSGVIARQGCGGAAATGTIEQNVCGHDTSFGFAVRGSARLALLAHCGSADA